jgi:hypothetical protein
MRMTAAKVMATIFSRRFQSIDLAWDMHTNIAMSMAGKKEFDFAKVI